MKIPALSIALATCAALALAACGPSGTSGGAPAVTPGVSTQSGSTQPGSTQPAAGKPKNSDVCGVLTAAAASQITGTQFTTTKSSSVEGLIFECEYGGPDSALLQVSVTTQNGKDVFDADINALKAVGHAPNLVPGVGDEAFSEPDPRGNAGSVGASAFASFGAVFGDVYVRIGGLTYVTADQGKQIAEQLHGKF
jgi:hypothetical protein